MAASQNSRAVRVCGEVFAQPVDEPSTITRGAPVVNSAKRPDLAFGR